jgi:hypothetical protein
VIVSRSKKTVAALKPVATVERWRSGATMSTKTADGESPPSLFGKVIQVRGQVILRRGKSCAVVDDSIVKVEFTRALRGAYGCF